jgi:hypothetical protein
MIGVPLPLAESYWVEPGQFLAGEHPAQFEEEQTRRRVDALIETGIDTCIDLTRANETFPYTHILAEEAKVYGVEAAHYRFPIGDFGIPTAQLMNAILDKIEESLRDRHKIYLHCWGGIGRTGTTVGCYLVRQGKTADAALNQLSSWWRGVPKSLYHPYSPETQDQVNFIRTWTEHDQRLRKTGA